MIFHANCLLRRQLNWHEMLTNPVFSRVGGRMVVSEIQMGPKHYQLVGHGDQWMGLAIILCEVMM